MWIGISTLGTSDAYPLSGIGLFGCKGTEENTAPSVFWKKQVYVVHSSWERKVMFVLESYSSQKLRQGRDLSTLDMWEWSNSRSSQASVGRMLCCWNKWKHCLTKLSLCSKSDVIRTLLCQKRMSALKLLVLKNLHNEFHVISDPISPQVP